MSLDDILKSINESTEADIKEVEKQGNKKVDKVKAEYKEKLSERKTKLVKQVQIEADRKVSQASFQAKSAISNKVLQNKRELIADVYSKALKKLSTLSESDNEKLLVKLIKNLPQLDKGEIIPAKGSEAIVKKAATTAKTSYPVASQTIKGSGGFIFISEGLEINNTLEQVINNLKEQTETEVTKILF